MVSLTYITFRKRDVITIITERDIEILKFIAKWRFATQEQLFKAGIFDNSCGNKTSYLRLLKLCKAKLIKSNNLSNKKLYYFLTPAGGEQIDLTKPWYAKIFKDAGQSTVLKCLIACDYSLVTGVQYLKKDGILDKLKSTKHDDIIKFINMTFK